MIEDLKYSLKFWKNNEKYKIQSDGFHCINVPEGCEVFGFFPIESIDIQLFKSYYGNQEITNAVDKLLQSYYKRFEVPRHKRTTVGSSNYNVYCDGSCAIHSTKSGRWAFALVNEFDELVHENSGTVTDTTNGETEVLAFYEALKYIEENLKEVEVTINCDSSYVVKSYNEWCESWKKKGWRKSNNEVIKHMETWIAIDKIRSEHITVQWVKGHANNKWNNYVDELTRKY